MQELFRSEYYTLTLDSERRLLYRTRSDRSFDTLTDAKEAIEAVIGVHRCIDVSQYTLLSDMRSAPARNDPEFEQLVVSYHRRFYSGFRRVAVIVKTQTGRLQIARMAKEHGISLRAFTDEEEALAYLESDVPPATPRSTR